MRKGLIAAGAILSIGFVSGCRQVKDDRYFGPTDPLDVVVQNINRNNQAIPTLYARHYTEANIYDPQKKGFRFINADGDLYVRKPGELYMVGEKDIAGTIFELGHDGQRYWLKVFVGDQQEWWGWDRNIGKPGAQQMPMQPELIGEVLGISDINTNLLAPPVPTMQFNNDEDVYMVVWNAPLPTHWYAQKAVWYKRKTMLPVKVLLFDHNGRVILRANLMQHKPVQIKGQPEASWPKIATYYDLFFPENKSTMTIKLSDMALTSKTGQPKAGMIASRFEAGDQMIPSERVIQIDKDCEK